VERDATAAAIALRHLGRLLGACLDVLPASHSDVTRFVALCVVNRAIDVCIWGRACCPLADDTGDDDGAYTPPAEFPHPGNETGATERRPSVLSARRLTRRDSYEHVTQVNLERVLLSHFKTDLAPPAATSSTRHSRPSSWRTKSPFKHQESQRSLLSTGPAPSVSAAGSDDTRDGAPSTADNKASTPVAADIAVGVAEENDIDVTATPLGVLSQRDPAVLLGVMNEALARHKALTGGATARHRCSPSVRSRYCAAHCVQILSARVFAVMCHDQGLQRQVVDGGHIRTLVDSLDPNHDPVSVV
jgi:hypothetical protein